MTTRLTDAEEENFRLWNRWDRSERGKFEVLFPLDKPGLFGVGIVRRGIRFDPRDPRWSALYPAQSPRLRCRLFGHLPAYNDERPRVCTRCGHSDKMFYGNRR
jgi:hypothetical protein